MIKSHLKRAYKKARRKAQSYDLAALLLMGKQMSWRVGALPPNTDFREVGFKVFSQWDEDGIIQYLIHNVAIDNKTFVEFGVEDYEESNTRFLLLNDHWHGMVLDASKADIRYIQTDKIYWQFDLQAKCAWINRENIDDLLRDSGFSEDIGLLSIDMNGNEYWVWEAVSKVRPRIVVAEYNGVFGFQPIAVPYREGFDRTAAHYSNLYYGCSLAALDYLAKKKGYVLVGSNVWGHNAFFLRSDVASAFRPLAVEEAYVLSKFRESRDPEGKLTYLRGESRLKLIEHLPVINVSSGKVGSLKDLTANEGRSK